MKSVKFIKWFKMTTKRIKIGNQQQAKKPIYLNKTGMIVCGNFTYKGRFKDRFKSYFYKIIDLVNCNVDEIDVSNCEYWDAIRIYEEYICVEFLECVKSEQMEKFANESEIFSLIDEMRNEFKIAVTKRWKRIIKQSDQNGKLNPPYAWMIL